MVIPRSIVDFVNEFSPHPAGVIGCHSDPETISYSCCEYDIAIFCENTELSPNRVMTLDGITIELIPLMIHKNDYISIRNMILLKDYDNFSVSSLLKKVRGKGYDTMLKVYGKKKIIQCLLLFEAINKNLTKAPILSSLWLKLAAYHFNEGILGIHNVRSHPLHELEQIRSLDVKVPEAADGINCALECIGLERAGRSVVDRSLNELKTLGRGDASIELLCKKSNWLMSHSRVVDCYYYIGRIVAMYVSERGETDVTKYLRSFKILLDLTTDSQLNHKLHQRLIKASKNALKS